MSSQILDDFCNKILRDNPPSALPVPTGPGIIHQLDLGITGFTFFRDGDLQAQIFIVPPNTVLPEHTHPNVEVALVYVTGQFFACKDGIPVVTAEQMIHDSSGNCPLAWKRVDLEPGGRHSATVGPQGCVFMSFQRWVDGNPNSIHSDWVGQPLGENHIKELDAAI